MEVATEYVQQKERMPQAAKNSQQLAHPELTQTCRILREDLLEITKALETLNNVFRNRS